ncbi:MAG: helix-turn-helix transcriptional regulator [Clostridia bacterium]|nr:helix-turn-helix transcriptional regulator [Clostridia bacterium]
MDGFAKRIKELRIKKGYTQAELGMMLDISPSAIGMYEQGRREPDSHIIMELSRIFGVSADYLLSGGEQGPREVEDALDNMRESLKSTGGLMFKGTLLDEQDTEKLFDAMLLAANILLKRRDTDDKEDNRPC